MEDQEFTLEFSAVYEVVAKVRAKSQEEAEAKIRQGSFEIVSETYGRVHPDTEFFGA